MIHYVNAIDDDTGDIYDLTPYCSDYCARSDPDYAGWNGHDNNSGSDTECEYCKTPIPSYHSKGQTNTETQGKVTKKYAAVLTVMTGAVVTIEAENEYDARNKIVLTSENLKQQLDDGYAKLDWVIEDIGEVTE